MKKPRQFRIDVDLLERFDKVNEKLAVNGSEVVRRMIKNYVEENERRMMEMKKKEENNMTLKVGQKFVDKHGRKMELVEINPEFEEKYVMSYKYEGDWVVAEFTEEEVREMKKA